MTERKPCQIGSVRFYRGLDVAGGCDAIGRKVLLTIMTRQFFPVGARGHLHCRHPEVLAARCDSIAPVSLEGWPQAPVRARPSFETPRKRAALRMTDESVDARNGAPPLPVGERSSRIVRCEAGEGARSIDGA